MRLYKYITSSRLNCKSRSVGKHLFRDVPATATETAWALPQKVLEFVRPGDVLIVWKLDRLGRSLSHLLAIVNTLKNRQVAFRSLNEGMVDTTTASGELLFHIFGAPPLDWRVSHFPPNLAALAPMGEAPRRRLIADEDPIATINVSYKETLLFYNRQQQYPVLMDIKSCPAGWCNPSARMTIHEQWLEESHK